MTHARACACFSPVLPTTCQPFERTDSERFARAVRFVREREQSRYRGNAINPLAAGMYKSIGELAVSSDFAVFFIKFIDANCERASDEISARARAFTLSFLKYVMQRLLALTDRTNA